MVMKYQKVTLITPSLKKVGKSVKSVSSLLQKGMLGFLGTVECRGEQHYGEGPCGAGGGTVARQCRDTMYNIGGDAGIRGLDE